LWCLRWLAGGGVDQTTVAKQLAYSTAQVSSTVEKLRVKGLIVQDAEAADRRRNLWQLSPSGSSLVMRMLAAVAELPTEAAA
jgi:DNA-binding MarR family transcriptional regulator